MDVKSAFLDSGSAENIISIAYAQFLGLKVIGPPKTFQLGNLRTIKSKGKFGLSRYLFASRDALMLSA